MSKTKRKVPRVPNRRVSSTENVAAKPADDTQNDPSQAQTNLLAPSSDGPTLPSLYEAAINPEGGIKLASHEGEDADGVSKRNKKRRKSGIVDVAAQAEEEATFAPMPADVQRRLNVLVDTMGESVPTYIKQLVPWELLPSNVNSSVEKRLGADFWSKNTVSVPIHTNAKISSTVNRLKNYLGVDKKDFPKELLPSGGAPEDLILSVMAQGSGTSKLASVFEIAKRVIAPGEVKIHNQVEKWYSYIQLASKIVEKKRKFDAVREYLSDFEEGGKLSNKQRKSKFERAMKRMEEAKNNPAQAGAMDVSEDEAFEPVGGEKQAKSKAVPILLIWISRKPIRELEEAFGEEVVYVTKRAWEGPRQIKVPKGQKEKKGDEKKGGKDAAKSGVKKDEEKTADEDGDDKIMDFDVVEGNVAPAAVEPERDDMDL